MIMRACIPILVVSQAAALVTGCTNAPGIPAEYAWPVNDHAFASEAVATAHPLASRAGLEMLERGGNAVDAAVAASFCLSVVRPYSCGIGGGGFMVIYDPAREDSPARAVAFNYRETAPASVIPDQFVGLPETASRFGAHAAGVPGTVAGLLNALDDFGTLDRAIVLAPAIRAADEGFPADPDFLAALSEVRTQRRRFPQLAAVFDQVLDLYDPGDSLRNGDLIRNQDQARALRLIAEQGAAAFYNGSIAEAIQSIVHAQDGLISIDDLRAYEVNVTEPLRGRFRDMEILAMPPPSSGGVAMLQIFGMLERRLDEIRMQPVNSGAYVHMLAEMMKHAFADRAEWLADPRFAEVPVERLLSDDYLDRRAWSISRTWTAQPQNYGTRRDNSAGDRPVEEDGGTSHISVLDSRGMAVACTETINLAFGSCVVVPGFGFTLNNEMDDFTTTPGAPNEFGLVQSERNAPQAGKRPLSSMSPTIVLQGDRVVAVTGASGGPRIISSTLQALINSLLYGMTAGESLARARFHHQWMPHVLLVEDEWQDETALDGLRAFGHAVDLRRESIGNVQLILLREGIIHAASDPRSVGVPAGH
jgi:gamma-glutamyltranspeptidase/glutathione hydrolase